MPTRKLIFVKAAAIVLLATSDLVAQALDPPYLREMPSVERVLSDQQTADTAETAARQMGALLQLKKMIEDAAGPRLFDRRVGLMPDETRICQDYYAAYHRISQSKDEYKKFTAMRGYDIFLLRFGEDATNVDEPMSSASIALNVIVTDDLARKIDPVSNPKTGSVIWSAKR
jgi:hypothetical protein